MSAFVRFGLKRTRPSHQQNIIDHIYKKHGEAFIPAHGAIQAKSKKQSYREKQSNAVHPQIFNRDCEARKQRGNAENNTDLADAAADGVSNNDTGKIQFPEDLKKKLLK